MSRFGAAFRDVAGNARGENGITLVLPTTSLSVDRGIAVPFPVVVMNESPAPLDLDNVLVLCWRSVEGELLEIPEARFNLPAPIAPGQSATVDAVITAASLGRFQVQVDLQGEGIGPVGSPLIQICVTPPERENLDYNKMFGAADLKQDYWSLVGPTSEKDYHALALAKLKWMQDCGLTPDSRILDVGCGTGQVGTAAEGFLSERGCYYGVDIAAEAVAFCESLFKRPNFHFAQSGMVSIPISGQKFDSIIFFSVFTHTYVDETRALLTEAKRLLAESGVILGDVFVSPFVSKAMGNRGAFEWERAYFVQIAQEVGLNVDTVVDAPWGRYVRRQLLKFTRRAPGSLESGMG